MTKNKNDETFPTDDYLKKDQYTKEFEDLNKRTKSLEERLGTNENLAKSFCEAVDSQSKMKDSITDHIVELLEENPKVQEALQKQVNKIDRNAVMSLIKKIGFAGWTLIIALLSGGLVFIIKK